MASGICDNILLATYFSATCPVVVAPGHGRGHVAASFTKANIVKLQSIGIVGYTRKKGELASGLYGKAGWRNLNRSFPSWR
jgi:phosphopantothenoylcysteine decarboxylase/phosphopantothenate--cysteine ligase